VTRIKVIKIAGRRWREQTDEVTGEVRLKVEVNGREAASLACTPRDLKDLVVGSLHTAGHINSPADILSLKIDRRRHRAVVETHPRSPTGRPPRRKTGKDPGLFVPRESLFLLARKLLKRSGEFLKTGGTHCAALCRHDEIVIFREDLGRHNALDKLIGAALLGGHDPADMFLLISSRMPSELMFKIIRSGISLAASLGAPTDEAVRIAKREGVTLIGFVRENSFNVYSGADKIQ